MLQKIFEIDANGKIGLCVHYLKSLQAQGIQLFCLTINLLMLLQEVNTLAYFSKSSMTQKIITLTPATITQGKGSVKLTNASIACFEISRKNNAK